MERVATVVERRNTQEFAIFTKKIKFEISLSEIDGGYIVDIIYPLACDKDLYCVEKEAATPIDAFEYSIKKIVLVLSQDMSMKGESITEIILDGGHKYLSKENVISIVGGMGLVCTVQ